MIALTEEKREELIEYAKEILVIHEQRGGDIDERDIFKIALAALTAVPEHHVFKHPLGKLFYSLVDASCKGHDDVYPVYPAPPVPEIKLVNSKNRLNPTFSTADIYWQGKSDGWNECIAEIKRLNGLGE